LKFLLLNAEAQRTQRNAEKSDESVLLFLCELRVLCASALGVALEA